MASDIMKFSLSSSLILPSRWRIEGRDLPTFTRSSTGFSPTDFDGSSTNPAEILKILKILENSNSSSVPLLNLGIWYIDSRLYPHLTSTTSDLNGLSCTVRSVCSAQGIRHPHPATMDAVDTVVESVRYYVLNFAHNVHNIFTDMDATRWIRLIAAVGAYLLLRPYLMSWGEKLQKKRFDKEMESSKNGSRAKISPNELRGHVEAKGEKKEGGVVGVVTEAAGGRKTRRRQTTQKGSLDEDGQQLDDDEDDNAAFMDQLVDYVEGEDGW
jgi:hypothetical protein